VRLGIGTSAITLGKWDVAAVMASYAAMLAVLAAVGASHGLTWPYYAGLGVAGAMMLYHWQLIRSRSREGCFKAFMHNNWVGGAIFAGIILSFPVGVPGR
jgi:4-hydroxybenzoate polyprenyltransferase